MAIHNSEFRQVSLDPGWPSHIVISDRVHRLLVTLSSVRPDKLVQLLSLVPILSLLSYFLVSIDLVYTVTLLARLEERKSNCFLN